MPITNIDEKSDGTEYILKNKQETKQTQNLHNENCYIKNKQEIKPAPYFHKSHYSINHYYSSYYRPYPPILYKQNISTFRYMYNKLKDFLSRF